MAFLHCGLLHFINTRVKTPGTVMSGLISQCVLPELFTSRAPSNDVNWLVCLFIVVVYEYVKKFM